MTKYNAGITAQKAGTFAASGAVGVIIEIVVDRILPNWFPGGLITAAVTTVWAGVSNWWKNK